MMMMVMVMTMLTIIRTRSHAALRAADLDWIVGPGYSSGGYILGCSQRLTQRDFFAWEIDNFPYFFVFWHTFSYFLCTFSWLHCTFSLFCCTFHFFLLSFWYLFRTFVLFLYLFPFFPYSLQNWKYFKSLKKNCWRVQFIENIFLLQCCYGCCAVAMGLLCGCYVVAAMLLLVSSLFPFFPLFFAKLEIYF